jgi:hypothetical protein
MLLLWISELTFTLRGLPRPNAQLRAHTGCISPNDVTRLASVSNSAIIGIPGPYFSNVQETKQRCWWRITQDFCTSIVTCLAGQNLTTYSAMYSPKYTYFICKLIWHVNQKAKIIRTKFCISNYAIKKVSGRPKGSQIKVGGQFHLQTTLSLGVSRSGDTVGHRATVVIEIPNTLPSRCQSLHRFVEIII